MRAVTVMWERQIKRFWRSRPRMIAMLGQPLLFLFAFGLGFSPIFAAAGKGDYIQFLAPGIIAMSVLTTSVFNGIEVIWDRQFGFLKETLVAPVSRFSIMLGKTLGGATVALIQGALVLLLSHLFGFSIQSFGDIIIALFFMFAIAVLFSSLGIAIASKMYDMHAFPLVMNFLVMPVFFLSGALFPLENLPPAMHYITRFNPLTYGVDGLRGALTGVHHFPLVFDALVLAAIGLVCILIGSYLFSKTEV